jgi:DNA/RNA-binding domain of Phe-tRNA-synthetase-like protein
VPEASGRSDLPVVVTDAWREMFPEARVGLLVLEDVVNPPTHARLEQRVREVEAGLRERFAGADRAALAALPVIRAYQRHYRAFGQTYHVLRQLESVALRGRSLASHGALVLAMFAAELEALLLTAGHDLAAVRPPLVVDRSSAGDRFIGLGGREHELRPGDMLMRDRAGIISAVVYGPDERTRLHERTRRALFTAYAPAGVTDDAVRRHLDELAALVRLVAPAATVGLQALRPAAG